MLQMVKQLLVHSNDNQDISESLDKKSYLIKSTQYPPQAIDSFDACYMLRVIYSSNNSNTTHDYYLFIMNGNTYMQNGKDGPNAKVDTELYNRIDTLLNSFNQPSMPAIYSGGTIWTVCCGKPVGGLQGDQSDHRENTAG